MKTERPHLSRPVAGAAVLREGLTSALLRAALIELARSGYASLSMSSVARRAGIGKPALYRRWSGKDELISDLLLQIGIPVVSVPDLGSIEAELREYATRSCALLRRPLAKAILPDFYAEMSRNAHLAALLHQHFHEPKRQRALEILDRAMARGEIPEGLDRSLALDLMGGALYWRLMVSREPIGPDYPTRFARMVKGALGVR